jgi:hypothetical protein
MAKSLRQVIKDRLAAGDDFGPGTPVSPIRSIKCPHCNWRAERRRRNALGDVAWLGGQLTKHLAKYHPNPQEVDAPLSRTERVTRQAQWDDQQHQSDADMGR